jgi:hypothetical protein
MQMIRAMLVCGAALALSSAAEAQLPKRIDPGHEDVSPHAISFRRLSTAFCMRLGRLSRSMHTPSIRYRRRTRSAIGSTWISLARMW